MTDTTLVPPALAEALATRGYETLTQVQSAVIAPELAGQDLLVSAQTGSGKTVAYFRVEWPGYMVISECRLVEGKNGLFAAMPQKEYMAAGVKKYKAIVYLEKPLQDKVNAAAIEAYQLLGRAPTEPEDIPW